MKGLREIPSTLNRHRAYQKLLSKSEKDVLTRHIALWSQWVRFDPRLGELLIDYLLKFWFKFNPLELNQKIKQQPWPASLGVILEQIRCYRKSDFSSKDFDLFESWYKCTMNSVRPAQGEQFFIGLMAIAGKQMQKESLFPTKSYQKWGYLGRTVMINKFPLNSTTQCRPAQRHQAIKALIEEGQPFSVESYRARLDFSVSRRQAQRDLADHPFLKVTGCTRNRLYIPLRKQK